MKFYSFLIITLAFFLCSCSGSYELTKFGDESTISIREGNDISGEFLFVTDSSFFISCLYTNEIYEIGFKKCNEVIIDGYSNRDWILPVILLEGVSALTFSIECNANTGTFPWYLMVIPAISYFLFESGTPDAPGINSGEINKYSAETLKKYSRFPQGVTQDQFRVISKNKVIKQIF